MNREFIYIDNNKVAVADDEGKITVREAERDMRDILVSEDKLSDLNTHIKSIRDAKIIEKASIELIDKWYKVMGIVSLAIAVTAPITLGITSGLCLIGGWAVVAAAACGYGLHCQRDSVKRINGYNKELKRAKDLKRKINEELEFTRELNKDCPVSTNNKVGEIVKIDSVKDFEEQDRSLNSAFRFGYKNTPKVLVKTKKNASK